MINLTAPLLLSLAFARQIDPGRQGRIVNLLDWRSLRPGPDHLPYTVSKVALAGLTRSLAQAFAPRIQVNGVALGAILSPADSGEWTEAIRDVPARRWADLNEVDDTVLFLLSSQACLLLGSNITPEHNLPRAMELLRHHVEVSRASRVWETPAVGSAGPNFLNAAILVRTRMEPEQRKNIATGMKGM